MGPSSRSSKRRPRHLHRLPQRLENSSVDEAVLESLSTHSILCDYCQILSDNLLKIKRAQEARDADSTSAHRLDSGSNASSSRSRRTKGTAFDHYLTRYESEASAEDGCMLCMLWPDSGIWPVGDEYNGSSGAYVSYQPLEGGADQWKITHLAPWRQPFCGVA